MANWQATVDIKDGWKKAEEHEISVQELAKNHIIPALKSLPKKFQEGFGLEDIVEEFEGLSDDENADTPEFDDVMSRLYDWADGNLVWVATF